MKRQLGIAQGWLLGIIAVIGLMVVTALGTWHICKRYTESDWQAREAKINADAAVKINAANTRVRDIEQAHAVQLNAVDTTYQSKLQEKDYALTAALNTVRSNGLFVRAACAPIAGNSDPKTAASSSGGDGGTGRQLLDESDAAFLVTEASRADKIAEQLRACQAVVRSDRAP